MKYKYDIIHDRIYKVLGPWHFSI